MTDYSPFAEPFTEDVDVLRRRTWEELRRIGTAVGQLSAGGGGGGDSGAAAYAVGYTAAAPWSPGVESGTLATRIPLQAITVSADVIATANTLSPTRAGDYVFDVRLSLTPTAGNEVWYMALFHNNARYSVELEVNNQSLVTRYVSLLGAIQANANDTFDIRLWPQFDTDSIQITLCEFELRRLSSVVGESSELENRVVDLETNQQVLIDGVYGSGSTSDLAWAPGISSPLDATRVPIGIYTVESNVATTTYGIQPLFAADYLVDLSLTFTGNQNNRNWTVAIFENGAQAGQGFEFNTRDQSRIHVSASFGIHMTPSDELDVRIWSTNASSTGTINDYTSNLILLGLDDTIT